VVLFGLEVFDVSIEQVHGGDQPLNSRLDALA
jgi:hypothetical protein